MCGRGVLAPSQSRLMKVLPRGRRQSVADCTHHLRQILAPLKIGTLGLQSPEPGVILDRIHPTVVEVLNNLLVSHESLVFVRVVQSPDAHKYVPGVPPFIQAHRRYVLHLLKVTTLANGELTCPFFTMGVGSSDLKCIYSPFRIARRSFSVSAPVWQTKGIDPSGRALTPLAATLSSSEEESDVPSDGTTGRGAALFAPRPATNTRFEVGFTCSAAVVNGSGFS